MSVPIYNSLDFDSELFKFPVASINLKKSGNLDLLADKVRENTPILFYLFNDEPLSIKKIEDKTGYIVSYHEERVIYVHSPKNMAKDDDCIKINQWQVEDISSIYQLGLASGEYSRFILDNKIPRAVFEQLYKLWVEKSLNNMIADDIILFKQDLIEGILTVKYTNQVAKVGLVAVNKNSRGLGIGKKLLRSVENQAFKLNNRQIIIPTQRINKNACRFYTNSGYQELESSFIYHCWSPNG